MAEGVCVIRRGAGIPGSLRVPSPFKKSLVCSRLSLSLTMCCAAHQSKVPGNQISLRQVSGCTK